jgi:hypothetical protein
MGQQDATLRIQDKRAHAEGHAGRRQLDRQALTPGGQAPPKLKQQASQG